MRILLIATVLAFGMGTPAASAASDKTYLPITAPPRGAPPSCTAAHRALDANGDGVLDERADAAAALRAADACINQGGGADAFVLRARANAALGQRDAAVADLSAAIRLRPNDADLYVLRAAAYADAGQLKKAQADLDQALRLRPGDEAIRKHKLTGHVTLVR